MQKTLTLIKREYLQRVKTKGFIAGTLLMPVFILAVAFLPVLFANLNVEKKKTIVVIDFSGKVAAPLIASIEKAKVNDRQEVLYRMVEKRVRPEDLEMEKRNLNQDIRKGKLDAYLIISRDVFETDRFEIYAKNVSHFDFNEEMRRFVSDTVNRIRWMESGLDAELVQKLTRHVGYKTFKVGEKGAREESSGLAFGITYMLVLVLYMALILYGAFVMTSVIEDKNSRVIEVIIASVRPHQFMAGKIIGTGAAGLTQFAIWVLFAALGSSYGILLAQQFSPEVSSIPLPSIPWWVYLAFLLYFLLGYFLYATLYAAMGSMVNSINESQNLQWPVLSPLIISILLMFGIINNPDTTLAAVLSLIPLFTPLLMFLRIAVNAAPLWQVLLSVVLMLTTTWAMVWVAGRIFRIGILMYGKRPTLPEVLKWVRYS